MSKIEMIGLGASGLVGKDTLFTVLSHILKDKVKLERIALADQLKNEVNDFCQHKYGISSFTKNPQEKELIRDIFIAHGKIKRNQTKGTYWTNLVQPRVDECKEDGIIPVCTDIRYSKFQEDEYHWLKNVNGGVYIHINRFDKNGIKLKPLNIDEHENSPKLEAVADYRLNWPTSDSFEFLCDIVKVQLKDLLEKI